MTRSNAGTDAEPTPNDAEALDRMIAGAQHGLPGSFDDLVDMFAARLYGFLLRITGRREDAEDLVQEVFARLVRVISSYAHEGRFEAWLFRIATNLARDRIRKIRRTPFIASLDGAPEGECVSDEVATSPDRHAELSDEISRMQAQLVRLPQVEREVILLRHYTRLSFAEIADMMDAPVGTVLSRSHRGLSKLRKWMADES